MLVARGADVKLLEFEESNTQLLVAYTQMFRFIQELNLRYGNSKKQLLNELFEKAFLATQHKFSCAVSASIDALPEMLGSTGKIGQLIGEFADLKFSIAENPDAEGVPFTMNTTAVDVSLATSESVPGETMIADDLPRLPAFRHPFYTLPDPKMKNMSLSCR
jgi:hypothetical protein